MLLKCTITAVFEDEEPEHTEEELKKLVAEDIKMALVEEVGLDKVEVTWTKEEESAT